jgi:hypothetical protein
MARARTTAVRVFRLQVPVAVFAPFTVRSVDVHFAVALTGNETSFRVLLTLANSLVQGATFVAFAWTAHVGIIDWA